MKKLLLSLIAATAYLGGVACFAQTNAEAFYYAGCSAFNAQSYKAALTNFTKSIELDSKMTITFCMRGRTKWELKDYTGAIADYDEAIALNPKCGGYYSNRGQAEYSLKMIPEAFEDFDEAIELDPKNAQAFFNRGNLKYHYLTNYTESIADFTTAIEIHDDAHEEDIYFWRGNARMHLKDYAGAIGDYKKTLEINPKHANSQIAMTNIVIAEKILHESVNKN